MITTGAAVLCSRVIKVKSNSLWSCTWLTHYSSAYVKLWQSCTEEEAGHIFKGKRASLPFCPELNNSKKVSWHSLILPLNTHLVTALTLCWVKCCVQLHWKVMGEWDNATGSLRHSPSSAKLYQCDFTQRRKLLTRTRLLTAAWTAATGAVRSGIPFPSTSPSSCIITRWDICWATGSRILSIVFVWKTGMVTTLEHYLSKNSTTKGSFLQIALYRSLKQSTRDLFPPRIVLPFVWRLQVQWKHEREKTPSQRVSASNLNVNQRFPPSSQSMNENARFLDCDWLLGLPLRIGTAFFHTDEFARDPSAP